MALDPALLEPILTTLAGGGLGAAAVAFFKAKPEKKKLEAEAVTTAMDASATAFEMLTNALKQIEAAQVEIAGLRAELREAREQVAELMTINSRLEAEVKNLRGRLAALEGDNGD